MTNEMFKKEAFKKSVKDNVKFLYRKTIEEATQEQIFQAVQSPPERLLSPVKSIFYFSCRYSFTDFFC